MAGRRDEAMASTSGELTRWDRSWQASERWTGYILLAGSTILSLLATEPSAGVDPVTLALVVLATLWMVFGHTTAPPERRAAPGYAFVYLAGLLVLAAALMSRDVLFFIFAIAGFLHAAPLRPLPLVFVGTAATSLLIHVFTWGGLPRDPGAAVMFGAIIVIQTFLIGFGVAGGEKLAELSEERRATLAALEASVAANETLQAELLHQARQAGVGQERQRMAREIHDTLAQGLTGVITQLEAAAQSEHDPPTRRRHVEHAAALARRSLTEARRCVQALAPGPLEHGRLPDALDRQVRDFARLHGVRADTVVTGGDVALPAEAEVALLRVAQEALTNVGKHAAATRVGVTLSRFDDEVLLDVRDDGCGFDPAGALDAASFGLTAMRQRLEELGGSLTVESRRGGGTAVSAALPLGARTAVGT